MRNFNHRDKIQVLQPDTVKIYWSCTAAVHGGSSTGSAPPAHGGRVVAVQAGRCTTHAPWAYSTRVVLCLYGRCRGRVHGCRAPRYHDTRAHPVDMPYKWSYKVDGVMNPRGATSSVPSYRTKPATIALLRRAPWQVAKLRARKSSQRLGAAQRVLRASACTAK